MSSVGDSWPCDARSYILERTIGHGAFAKVYTASCRSSTGDCNRVAVKVMDLDNITVDIAEISKEVQLMRLCSHTNVLCCYSSFVHRSELYLVMPLMEKGSCLRIMQAAKRQGLGEGMSEDWLGYILFEVLQGLGYLHENGHLHRDIKAGNILLDGCGRVALADFGVSSWLVHSGNRRQTTQTFVGTPCWMAPEVMEQVAGYDYKADIWSFGITALELAKGFAPYAFYPPMKVLLLTIQEEPPSLRSYSTEKSCTGASFSRSFKEMVRMCLQKEARKRPTVNTLLNSKFFKIQRSVLPLISNLLNRIKNITVADETESGPGMLPMSSVSLNANPSSEAEKISYSFRGIDIETDVQRHALFTEEDNSCNNRPCPHEATGSDMGTNGSQEEFARGTTWTFDDGHEVVLKSESYIRREIDAKCAQDEQECEAIFDDLEDLMKQRGGEWDFKKNQNVRTYSRWNNIANSQTD
eukprot:CAMPEP_0185690126 /NCGR_PEP_ID=MMETSP1164-20130828/926_1 /TAXON_ID=1104430 /ORGANISM="Chrysoreinhardia sp, Strain CCMP2950" /LENGTH=467 /DNA_ID=CAMNT_0028356681 /DNA_START=226 /DNA_END=1629 /DNA_ORIENTATION=-